MGADLPIIHAEEEKDFINSLIPKGWAFWLGGSANFEETPPYNWYDGTEVSSKYRRWDMPYDINDDSLSTCYDDDEMNTELCIRWTRNYWMYVSCTNIR
eukprot:UN13671